MINYAHLKSQMIQLLDLLRSILYPNVFDASGDPGADLSGTPSI